MARDLPKADLLKRYKGRLKVSRRWREQECYDDTWRRLIDLYRGKVFPAGMTAEDRIHVAIAFGTINVIYPSVSINYPKITVAARQPDEDAQAVITETVINYWWRHYDVKPEFRRAVKDFLVLGHGWLKVGYRYREQELNLGEEEQREAYDDARAEAAQYAEEFPEEAGNLPTDDDIQAGVPQTKLVPIEDRPFVERVSPFNIFVDPEATSMNDLGWIAQKIVRPLEEVKKDERYKQSARRKLGADSSLRSDWMDDDNRKRLGDDIKRVTVWEFYDLCYGTMCVFAEGSDDFLVEPQPMPYDFGHPFVMMRNYDVPDQFYPLGDLEALEPLQMEVDAVRSDMRNHRKRYARKYLYKPSSFGPEGRAALESPEDGTFVPVADENSPLSDHIYPVPATPLDPQMYQYSQTISADIDSVSGVSEYARGGLPEIRRTATEASIIQDASNARAADKLSLIEDGVRSVAQRLVQLAQQFLTGEQVARVMGNQGLPLWVTFQPEDIAGEFDFEVEAGSTQPQNDTFRRQQATQMLQTLTPFVESGLVNAPELLKYVLQFGFGVKNPERFISAGPPPLPAGAPLPPEAGPDGQPLGPPQPPGVPLPAPDQSGMNAIPPEVLQQLAEQVGLNLNHVGQS